MERAGIFLTVALFAAVNLGNLVGAEEDRGMKAVPAAKFCSEIMESDESYHKLKGRVFVISGIVSSVGDKRRAFLGNRINSVVELIISPEVKKDAFGRRVETGTTCLISSQVKVPGQECQLRNGKYECRDITNPRLEENRNMVLKLSRGEAITVMGRLEEKSVLHQYGLGDDKIQIVNISLSDSEIISTLGGNRHE